MQREKHEANDKKYLCELHGALLPIFYNYVRSFKTAKEIRDTLKEIYQGSEKTKKSSMKQYLSELGECKMNDNNNRVVL